MGNVVSLNAFRSKKPKLKLGITTEEEAFELAKECLFSRWQFESEQNNLNGFIAEKLYQEEVVDWIGDRNKVAELEDGVGLEFSLMSPGFTFDNLLGWQASFVIGDNTYETPVLEHETHARVYCILLYLALLEAASEVKANAKL